MVNQALILCGGSGARLGALTADTPKPLLPVGDRPFLDVLLFALGRQGVTQVVLLASFRAEQVERYARRNALAERFGIDLSVVVEPARAGTGGALHNAAARAGEEFFLLNGDTWFDLSLDELRRSGAGEPQAVAMLALRRVPDVGRFGRVVMDGGRVLAFQSRPAPGRPGLVNAGVYLMRRSIFAYLEPACSLETDVLPPLAAAGLLGGVAAEGFFIDIGVPGAYARAQEDVPARMTDLFRAA